MADIPLAIAHHLLVFTLTGVLAAELVLVRIELTAPRVRALGAVDALYGALAVLIVIVGIARVAHGTKGPDFYLPNHVFWTKMGAFVVVGLLSVAPSVLFFRWRKRAKTDPAVRPPESELKLARRFLVAEIAVFLTIPVWAVLMARGVGL
jgi:putative membrane protein